MTAEAEHSEGDECVGWCEAEGDVGDESDLGVHGFDTAVGKSVFDGGEDGASVSGGGSLELNEGVDATASGRGDPWVQGLGCLVEGERKNHPEAFS